MSANNDLEQGFPDDEDEDYIDQPNVSLIGHESNNALGSGGASSQQQRNYEDSWRFQSITGNISSGIVTAAGCSCKHPIAAFFHLFFKIAALFCYFFLTFFTSNFVLVFVTCILLLSFDFWTVKNVTGRLLVGLRWWNEVQPDGSSVWRFESKEDMSSVDAFDSTIFWVALYAQPLIWLLLSITCFIGWKFQWFMVIGFALVLSLSNAIGYFKCQRDATSKLSNWFVRQSFVQSLMLRFLGGGR